MTGPRTSDTMKDMTVEHIILVTVYDDEGRVEATYAAADFDAAVQAAETAPEVSDYFGQPVQWAEPTSDHVRTGTYTAAPYRTARIELAKIPFIS